MTYTYSYSPWLTLYSTCLELVAAPRARARTGTRMGMARTRTRPRTWTFPALEDRSSESRATRLLLAEEEACELRAARAAVFPTRCARSCQVPDARTRTPGARTRCQEPGGGAGARRWPLAAGCCPVPYAHPVVATGHDRRQGDDSSQRRRPTIYVRGRVQKALATRDLSQEPTLSLLSLSSSTWAGVMSVHAHGEAEGQGHGRGRVDVDAAAWRGCGPGPLGRHEWGAIVRRTTPGARGSLEK